MDDNLIRITRLEEKMSYLEQTLSELDEVVRDLNQQLKAANLQISDMRAHVGPVDEDADDTGTPPPHWGNLGSAGLQ